MKILVPSLNKTFNIPQSLLNEYADTIIYNERVSTMQRALGKTEDEIMVKIMEVLEKEHQAHKAIFNSLGLDYEKREQGTDEGFVAEGVYAFWKAKREGKPELTEFTVNL